MKQQVDQLPREGRDFIALNLNRAFEVEGDGSFAGLLAAIDKATAPKDDPEK